MFAMDANEEAYCIGLVNTVLEDGNASNGQCHHATLRGDKSTADPEILLQSLKHSPAKTSIDTNRDILDTIDMNGTHEPLNNGGQENEREETQQQLRGVASVTNRSVYEEYDGMVVNVSAILDEIDWSLPDIDAKSGTCDDCSAEERINETDVQSNNNQSVDAERPSGDSCRISMMLRNDEEEVLLYVLGNIGK